MYMHVGDLYFDKLVGGFLKELFHRWSEQSCSHEVTLAFFWRVYYQPHQIGKEVFAKSCGYLVPSQQ